MTLADYILKNVEPHLWREFKGACAFYGMDMRHELIRHIRNIVADFHKAQQEEARAKLILTLGRKKP